MIMCVQEEGRLLTESSDTVLLTAQESHSKKTKDVGKGKTKLSPEPVIKKESKCFFCKKKGHRKKDCIKFKAWFDKKGIPILIVCYESNMVHKIYNTLWIDFGFTIHLTNTLQDMQNMRNPITSEQIIYLEKLICSHMEAIGICVLHLDSGLISVLKRLLYSYFFPGNVISVSSLVLLNIPLSFWINKIYFINPILWNMVQ